MRRFDKSGTQLAVYPAPAELLALTPDASGFWAAGTHPRIEGIYRVDFAAPGSAAVVAHLPISSDVRALGVIGEGRASSAQPRRRAVGR